jgi:hypothetical protein
VALSDYSTELLRVYDFFNYYDRVEKQVRELYSQHSYFVVLTGQKDTMRNIRDTYLNKFDLLQAKHPIVTRYAYFLF